MRTKIPSLFILEWELLQGYTALAQGKGVMINRMTWYVISENVLKDVTNNMCDVVVLLYFAATMWLGRSILPMNAKTFFVKDVKLTGHVSGYVMEPSAERWKRSGGFMGFPCQAFPSAFDIKRGDIWYRQRWWYHEMAEGLPLFLVDVWAKCGLRPLWWRTDRTWCRPSRELSWRWARLDGIQNASEFWSRKKAWIMEQIENKLW